MLVNTKCLSPKLKRGLRIYVTWLLDFAHKYFELTKFEFVNLLFKIRKDKTILLSSSMRNLHVCHWSQGHRSATDYKDRNLPLVINIRTHIYHWL